MIELIKRIIASESLVSNDPYDIWATRLGRRVKRFYHAHPSLGVPPSVALTVFDRYINNNARWGYVRREYAGVRAMAAQAAILMCRWTGDAKFLDLAAQHLDWLSHNRAKTSVGAGWGHGFEWVVSQHLTYPADAGLATTTPYALEALVIYNVVSGSGRFRKLIDEVLAFYDHGLVRLIDSDKYLATSYSDRPDRVITNAVSYVMLGYALTLDVVPECCRNEHLNKVERMKNFVESMQQPNGAWYYDPFEPSFIDCFHSCIIVKNLKKTEWLLGGTSSGAAEKGFKYIKEHCYDRSDGLMKRFSIAPRPWVAKYDLYDNAEAIVAALMVGDHRFARTLLERVQGTFVRGATIFSEIDKLGFKKNPDTLRWAVMPFSIAYLLAQVPDALRLYGAPITCAEALPIFKPQRSLQPISGDTGVPSVATSGALKCAE